MSISFEIRRKFIQFAALILTNREIGNLFSGKIYKGEEKYLCAPGINCYSCPAATLSCPIGALQTVGGAAGYGISLYAFGFIMLFGVIFGRAVCGFFCPFGLFQELLHKIPLKKIKLFKPLIYLKYFTLTVFVLLLPVIGAKPAFCEYICPAGTLEAALPLILTHSEYRESLGFLFILKMTVLFVIIVGSVNIYRFFCRTLCPLGAFYGLLNKISVYGMTFNKDLCVSCGSCKNACPMELNPALETNNFECVRCGKCAENCKNNALSLKFEQFRR